MKKNLKGKNILYIIVLILLTTGICMILYPKICQLQYQHEADRIISEFERRIKTPVNMEEDDSAETDISSGISGTGWEWLYKLMSNYNEKLYREKQINLDDPFSYSQVDFSLMEFGFHEEMIGYLSVPKMEIRLPIYLGANKENMKKGTVHLTQTSLPVGGVNTNAVIAAHRGLSTAAMFRDIEKLKIGDEVTITNFHETLYYRVAEIKVIYPADIDDILIQPGRDLITLITCHPYRYNYQRYVVYCERVTEY